MKYAELGLVNTNDMFTRALQGGYAVPAFNFYNMESLRAIVNAARLAHSPVILAVSESALKYMGADMVPAMVGAMDIKPYEQIALHLDHGRSVDAVVRAIECGFSSVMIDASDKAFDENVEISKQVADIAHKYNVSVEAELGTLGGIEDENTFGNVGYTNPDDVVRFVAKTGIDSLAIAIGTSHGAYKRKREDEDLRFDILADVAQRVPDFPLVLHGASSVPRQLVATINEFGGKMSGALGISDVQLRRATKMNVCKINVDSDLRLAFCAAVRKKMAINPENFNPRDFLGAAMDAMTKICLDEIREIMGSENRLEI